MGARRNGWSRRAARASGGETELPEVRGAGLRARGLGEPGVDACEVDRGGGQLMLKVRLREAVVARAAHVPSVHGLAPHPRLPTANRAPAHCPGRRAAKSHFLLPFGILWRLPPRGLRQRSWSTVGRATGTMVSKVSRPLKSSGLVVNSGRSSAMAIAAIMRSATRRRGVRPALMTAAQTLP